MIDLKRSFASSLVLLAFASFGVSSVAAAPKLQVKPMNPYEGDAVVVTVRGVKERPLGSALSKDLVFHEMVGGWQAVFAIPLEKAPEKLDVVIRDTALRETLEVRPREITEDDVEVAPEFAAPPADKIKQLDDDNQAVISALRSEGAPQFAGRFAKPGSGKVTSAFGGWRTFNGGHRSRHLGMDLAAKKGSPVKAINAGTVTLVADTFLMGKVVVIGHGAGIGSTYFHLHQARVEQGDEVKRGQRIGSAGDGGRTNGPHIHLGVWVQDAFVDPASFAKLPLLAPRPAK